MKISCLHLAAAILFAPTSPAATQKTSQPQPATSKLEEQIQRVKADLADQEQNLAATDAKAEAARQKADSTAAALNHKENGWLANHALTLQASAAITGALLTFALAITTIVYAATTHSILTESRKTTHAAQQQARAAEETLRLVQLDRKEQLRLGTVSIAFAIAETRQLLTYWSGLATRSAVYGDALPDSRPLEELPIDAAMNQAQRLSPNCAQLLSLARSNVRQAKTEIEKQRCDRVPFVVPPAQEAASMLDRAIKLLDDASSALYVDLETLYSPKPTQKA